MSLKSMFSITALLSLTVVFPTLAQDQVTVGAQQGPVKVISAVINGAYSNQTHVAPGAQFSVQFYYSISDTGCPGCIDQIQVGFADQPPVACAYDGEPGPIGLTRPSKPISLTAPTTPGIYYIAIDRSQDFSCPTNAWWSGTPQPHQYIAAVAVF